MIDSIRDRCWSCRQEISRTDRTCPQCGATVNITTGRGQPSAPFDVRDGQYMDEASAYFAGESRWASIVRRKWIGIAAAVVIFFLLGILFVGSDFVSAIRSGSVGSGPRMEVWWTRDQDGQRLHFLSKDQREFVLTDVIVNDRRECAPIIGQNLSLEKSVQDLGRNKLTATSDIADLGKFSKSIEGLTLAMMKLQLPPPPWTFKLGDAKETIFACEPVTVYIETNLGNLRLAMRGFRE